MKKVVLACLIGTVGTACGVQAQARPVLTLQERDAVATLYATGETVSLPAETRWRYFCGSDTAGLTNADLAFAVQNHVSVEAAASEGQAPSAVVNTSDGRGGLNVVFNVSGNPPAGALAALAEVEQVIESQFFDSSSVVVSVSFQGLNPGVLGATGSGFVNNTWANARAGLQNGADADDDLLAFLPAGSTIPVRYNASNDNVTNENRVFFTDANFKATIGSLGGTDANITISTNFNFDFDPSNGISGGAFSFNDVMIHEVGHAMGFVSGVDFRNNDIEALDIFRFQRTDGNFDYDPDTFSEFQTTPRTVDFNNLNDNANSDIIEAEYRMSDGSPSQASHFREQGGCGSFPNQIGIMDPSFGPGCTFLGRDYYTEADLNMFDLIGYDRVEGEPPLITTQPVAIAACEGTSPSMFVTATGDGPLLFQWFNALTLQPLPGETTDTLTFTNIQPSDAGLYFCRVDGPFGTAESIFTGVTVTDLAEITSQPSGLAVTEGDSASFSVSASGPGLSFQWRLNGTPLPGETSSSLSIPSVELSDAGTYTVAVTNACNTVVSSGATLTVEPLAEPCLADVNGDGLVTPADFTAWIVAFNSNGPGCDQNGDGLCGPADFSPFILNYNAGCP
ncbi:MAG: NF038122 family metalloprotease [Planctomycetota bacterium]